MGFTMVSFSSWFYFSLLFTLFNIRVLMIKYGLNWVFKYDENDFVLRIISLLILSVIVRWFY